MFNLMNKLCSLFPSSFRSSGLIAALMFLICLTAFQSARAATFTVNNTLDSSAGSLRAAITSANLTIDPDTIEFAIPAGDTGCTAGVCTITLTSGELAITSASTSGILLITNSTGASNLLISGSNTSRVFFVNIGANLTINGVTITKGNSTVTSSGLGGGILINLSTLTLTNSIVSGNTARDGGGIHNNGIVTLTNSTISGNMATSTGGGIFHGGAGTLNMTNSTVSGNMASSEGGGIFNFGGPVNLTSVTVTQNKLTNTSCTICAGGIRSFGSIPTLKNTIIAGNTAANASAPPDFRGEVAAGSSYNLIGDGLGTTGITNADANHNQVGVDPKLAPTLQLNGGTTPNHALLFGSPALDQGNSFGLTTDQRGFPRPFDNPSIINATGGNGADIGAFEAQTAPTAATVSVGGRVLTASGRGIVNVRLSLTDPSGQIRTATTTSFGYYRFDAVQAGETYILSASGKRYTFSQPMQVLNINEETDAIDFIASSEMSLRNF